MTIADKIKKLYNKYREPAVYIFFGGLTTFVNFAVYCLLTDVCGVYYIYAQVVSWVAAVVFAFFVNKIFVFNDRKTKGRAAFAQFKTFVGMRATSFLVETALLWLFVEFAGFNDIIVKAAVSVLVVIMNYIFSKAVIFKKR